jgi:hypothetical protein
VRTKAYSSGCCLGLSLSHFHLLWKSLRVLAIFLYYRNLIEVGCVGNRRGQDEMDVPMIIYKK